MLGSKSQLEFKFSVMFSIRVRLVLVTGLDLKLGLAFSAKVRD